MHHTHLETCISTQSILKENFSDLSKEILVSTDNQTQGFGRKGSNWSHFEYALAFSFTLPLNETLTLTPLEIGCLIADFFKPSIFLKWPNDLINRKGEKVGGILCQLIGKNLIVGIGLNLFVQEEKSFEYPVGGVFESLPELAIQFKETLPKELTLHIRNQRLSAHSVKEHFNKYCCHLGREVLIVDGTIEKKGKFMGITEHGEALLKDQEGIMIKVLTGSLRF